MRLHAHAWLQALATLLLLSSPAGAATLSGGKLYVDGHRVFLKTAVPLANFASEDLRSTVDTLLAKGYNNFKINLYWHHFDTDGDGILDQPLTTLNQLIAHIESKQALWALSFETYNVGGGGVPPPFFATNPDAQAVNSSGKKAVDSEYGTGKPVPSIFHPAYLKASRDFIKNVIGGLNSKDALYFETTVEPQYIGNQALDYSAAAQAAYSSYCSQHSLPFSWPPAETDAQWNAFRAEALAAWIEGDIQAIRAVAGAGALVAVDYLETGGAEMQHRNGGSAAFLAALDGVDILQCNWHWQPGTNKPFDKAYSMAQAAGKGWALTEHMTLNGSDFTAADIPSVLQHTLTMGNQLGWEVVNTRNSSTDAFTVYNSDWSPKATVAPLDSNHAYWMSMGLGGGGATYAAAYVAQQYPAQMESGKQYTVWVDLQNIGTATWDQKTRLATTVPQDRASPFYTQGSWLGPNRPAAAAATPTGQVARFQFVMTAPPVTSATTYKEHFGLVQDGVQWFTTPPPSQIWFSITVYPEGQGPDGGAAADGSVAPDAGPAPPPPDATADAGPVDTRPANDTRSDGATANDGDGGCGCRIPAVGSPGPLLAPVLLLLWRLRRHHRPRRSPPCGRAESASHAQAACRCPTSTADRAGYSPPNSASPTSAATPKPAPSTTVESR